MKSPFEGSATLEILKAVQLFEPDFTSGLKFRPASANDLGIVPEIVGRLRAYKERVRIQDRHPSLSAREHNLNLARMQAVGGLITLELQMAFPLEEGTHILWAGGEVGKKLRANTS